MTRVQRTLVTALVVLGAGGGAAAWVYSQDYAQQGAKKQAELTEARLFTWGRFLVQGFTLTTPSTRISATCTEQAGCRLTAPLTGPADAEAMQALLDNIAALQLERELASGPEAEGQLTSYGLAPAPITFTATTTDGRVHRLYVGDKSDVDGLRYVAGGSPLRLGLARDNFYWALDRDLYAFRAKQVFELGRDDIARVTIEKLSVPPRTLVLSRGEPLWSATSDGQTYPVDPFVIDRFQVLLTRDLRADAFVTDALQSEQRVRYGLDHPAFRVHVETRAGRVEHATVGVAPRVAGLGEPDQEGSPTPYVHVEGSSSVAVVYPALTGDLDKTAADFRDRRVLEYELADARRIEITHAGQPTIVMEGSGKQWRVVSPVDGPAKLERAGAIALRYSKLRATRVMEDGKSPERLKALELEPPQLRLVIKDAAGKILGDLRAGKPVDKKLVHVTAVGVDRIDAIPDGELRLLPMTAEDMIAR